MNIDDIGYEAALAIAARAIADLPHAVTVGGTHDADDNERVARVVLDALRRYEDDGPA